MSLPNPMSSILDLLTRFSFAPQEAEVYLASLSLGTAKLTALSRKVGKNRTAVYFHARNLVAKGVLKKTKKGRLLFFSPIPPRELAEQFDALTTNFKSEVPQLEALSKIEKDLPTIEVSESRAGYFKVYDEIASLPVGSLFRAMEGRRSLESELKLLSQEEWGTFFKRIVERKIETKGLFTKEGLSLPGQILSRQNTEILRKRIWHLRTTTEERLPFMDMLLLYGHKAAFVFPDTSLVVTLKHAGIARSLTCMFDALFLFAEPERAPWSK